MERLGEELTALVYLIRGGRANEELRYSLRSMSNLPHDGLIIIGSAPQWLRGAEIIGHETDRKTKWSRIADAISIAAKHPAVPDEFVYCNDDFYVMAPVETMPVYHRGPICEAPGYTRGGSSYTNGFRATERTLHDLGVADVLNYELHLPMPMSKPLLFDAFGRTAGHTGGALHVRTFYGNLNRIGGERLDDVKIHGRGGNLARPFLSSNDGSFASCNIGRHVRAMFPEPSEYEG